VPVYMFAQGRARCTDGVRVFRHQAPAPKVDGRLCIKPLRFNSDLIFVKPPRNRLELR
jgi:hypothetical protein